jgi:hypothetical protein
MPIMSDATARQLERAVASPTIVARYHSHVVTTIASAGPLGPCWWWIGAVAGNGHGRFYIGSDSVPTLDGRVVRQTFTVIAHRFGFALHHGVDALRDVTVLAHRCDNPLCQRPQHWRESTPSDNRREYIARRATVRGALADRRGARGRARELRNAVRNGLPLDGIIDAGHTDGHRNQLALFD